MKPGRRLSLQLTPLLDLLLIVIFAQYLEVRDRQAAVARQTDAAVVERDRAVAQVADLESRLSASDQSRRLAESQLAMSNTALSMQKEQIDELNYQLDRTLNQERVLGEIVVSLFNLPQEEVRRILQQIVPAGTIAGSVDADKLRQEIQRMSSQKAGEMIRHLLSYEQIRKRVDVWELHLAAGPRWMIYAEDKTHSYQVPLDADDNFDSERFVSSVFDWYRSLPQPKSRVILLLTYDRGTRSYLIREARRAMPTLIERMEKDSAGRSNFEYTELGFRLD